MPEAGPVTIFVPQLVISYGNGVLLPNAIAGAVSVRPHAAGSAAGLTGFVQMALGAASTQVRRAVARRRGDGDADGVDDGRPK